MEISSQGLVVATVVLIVGYFLMAKSVSQNTNILTGMITSKQIFHYA